MQGQEARTLGSGDNDAENTHSSVMWGSKLEDFTEDDLGAVRSVGSRIENAISKPKYGKFPEA